MGNRELEESWRREDCGGAIRGGVWGFECVWRGSQGGVGFA